MGGRIRQEDVDAVRERTDLVQVVSAHLQLKKAGRDSLVGLCPFHAEKTPSFSVSPSKQVYYCFGCGEAGNVFRFLEKVEGLSFVEAVERLAAQVGVTLRYEGGPGEGRAAGRRQALHRAVGEAAQLYHRMLLDGREAAEARRYLSSRGLSRDSVVRFGVGYAPGYPDFLLKRLSRTFSPELLVEAGLVARDGGGGLRDRFRGRIVFPIYDLSGNPVGFGARLLPGPGAAPNAAKYVNSPETPIYRKGRLLYNLHRAKADVTRSGRAFLVEGYTDVMALDGAGISTAVATCGTALGEEHVRLLARFAERVVLAFDSDEAGARAAERAFEFFERYPVELSVLVLPEGRDPADFVQAEGPEAGPRFVELAERAVPLVEYMLDRAIRGRDLSSAEAQSRAARAVVEGVLTRVRDPVLRERYAVLAAARVGVSENAILLELDRAEAASRPAGGPGRAAASTGGGGPLGAARGPGGRPGQTGADGAEAEAGRKLAPWQKVEREAIKLLLQAPELCGERLRALASDRFAAAGHRAAFEVIREARSDGANTPVAALVEAAQARPRGEQVGRLIAALAVEPPATVEVGPEYVDQVFLRLEEFALKRQAEQIRKSLERLNPITASEEYEALYEQFVRLEGARRRVRAAAEAVGNPP